MEKKIWFIIAAVVAFFGGAIWVSEAPTWASLVCALEVVCGFLCGYFFKKCTSDKMIAIAQDQNITLNKKVTELKNTIDALKAEKTSKKNKE